jgi:hypothetical protein
MKTLLTYQGISIVVEVPNKAKIDFDDKDLADFQFGSSQESEIEPPLVIDSIWDCPGIPLDTIEEDGHHRQPTAHNIYLIHTNS